MGPRGMLGAARAAGEDADLGDEASGPDGFERLRQRVGAAYLDNAVHPLLAGDLGDPFGPVRGLAVVAGGFEAEGGGAGEFFVAGGDQIRAETEQFSELEREERDAAGSLKQDGVPLAGGRDRIAGVVQRVPGGKGGAGERGGFLVGEVRWERG